MTDRQPLKVENRLLRPELQLAVAALMLAACATPIAPPQPAQWVFRPGQDITTLAHDTALCEQFGAAVIPGLKAAQERPVSNKEFAYALVTFPFTLLGGLDLGGNHAALVIRQKIRGPRPWTVEDEQAFRTRRMQACLRMRGYRDVRD